MFKLCLRSSFQGILQWIFVDQNTFIKNVTVPDITKNYQFAISANSKDGSSGMVWAKCTIIHNKGKDWFFTWNSLLILANCLTGCPAVQLDCCWNLTVWQPAGRQEYVVVIFFLVYNAFHNHATLWQLLGKNYSWRNFSKHWLQLDFSLIKYCSFIKLLFSIIYL